MSSGRSPEWSTFIPEEAGVESMWTLFQILEEKTGVAPIIVDAGDLLAAPETVLATYCELTGLTYDRSMIDWSADKKVQAWDEWGHLCYETLLESRGFRPTISGPLPDTRHLPPDVVTEIEHSLPFYQALAARKLVV